jgi:hypothetical protein
MNVSKKADDAFMRELERTDPRRYENLQRNMRRSVRTAQLQKQIRDHKAQLGGRPKKHKNNAEKQRAYRNNKKNDLSVTKPLELAA